MTQDKRFNVILYSDVRDFDALTSAAHEAVTPDRIL